MSGFSEAVFPYLDQPTPRKEADLPMNTSPSPETIRLTMSQALVKYLQVQYSERDGARAA